jgi:hypothetical protein
MSNLKLTKEELEYVELCARDRHGRSGRLWFYASVLLPTCLFAAYGVLRRDFIAESVAFVGAMLFISWRISQEFGRMQVFQGLMRKISDHQKGNHDNA